MHIGFFHLYPTSRLYLELARRIAARVPGATFTGVLPDHRSTRFAAASGSDPVRPVDLCRFVAEGWDRWDISPAALRRLEERYGTPHLWYHVYADRVVAGWPMEDLHRLVVATAAFWEQYIREHRPTVFLNSGIAHLPTFLGWHVFRAHGIPFVTIGQAKVKGRFYLGHAIPTHEFDGLGEEYERLRREGMTEEEREAAVRYVETFRGRPTAPMAESAAYRRFQRLPGLRNAPDAVRWMGRALAAPFHADYRDAVRAGGVPSYGEIFRGHVGRAVNWRRYRLARVFETPPPAGTEPYAYYALHFQPEATTLVNGQFWTNQLALVENIARSLPITHRLYVKEHRVNLGSRPVAMLKAIARIPNVRLLSPFADAHALSAGSELVFSIAGTTGLEGMLYRKPVVVFGDVFYTRYAHAFPAKEPEALPAVVHRALNGPQPDEEELLRFMAACIRCTHPGFLWHGEARSFDPANLDRVADVVVERLLAPALRPAAVPA
jgi:hypothetical protein